jgi:hypothetical protein
MWRHPPQKQSFLWLVRRFVFKEKGCLWQNILFSENCVTWWPFFTKKIIHWLQLLHPCWTTLITFFFSYVSSWEALICEHHVHYDDIHYIGHVQVWWQQSWWGGGLPEGTQVPTLRPILNVSDNLHISGDVPTMHLRSMMSMNVLNLLVQVRLIECCWCRIDVPIKVRVLNMWVTSSNRLSKVAGKLV